MPGIPAPDAQTGFLSFPTSDLKIKSRGQPDLSLRQFINQVGARFLTLFVSEAWYMRKAAMEEQR